MRNPDLTGTKGSMLRWFVDRVPCMCVFFLSTLQYKQKTHLLKLLNPVAPNAMRAPKDKFMDKFMDGTA